MAYSRASYTGDGITTNREVPFEYLDQSHVKVKLDGVISSDWTWVNANTISISPAPASGVTITVYRQSSPGDRVVDLATFFEVDGEDLDEGYKQIFFLAQEALDGVEGYATIGDTADLVQANKDATDAARDDAEAAATAAAASQASASTSASTASAAATTATTKAAEAAASAASIVDDASAAAASEIAAAASAAAAAVSESNAATSETNAAASAASLATQETLYLGPKATNPTTDNQGGVLEIGALYFNTTSDEMRAWNGSAWVVSYNPTAGSVDSVFGRTGAVVAVAGDYGAGDITNDSTVTGATVKDALETLDAGKTTTTYVDSAIAAVRNGVSAAYDTLAEIATVITAILGRTISAGTGLTGGGDLSANRTISIDKAADADVYAATADKVFTTDLMNSASATVTMADAATWAWTDFINGEYTATADFTLGNPTGVIPGTYRTIIVKGNTTTARVMSLGTNFKGDLPSLADITDTKWYELTLRAVTATHILISSRNASP